MMEEITMTSKIVQYCLAPLTKDLEDLVFGYDNSK